MTQLRSSGLPWKLLVDTLRCLISTSSEVDQGQDSVSSRLQVLIKNHLTGDAAQRFILNESGDIVSFIILNIKLDLGLASLLQGVVQRTLVASDSPAVSWKLSHTATIIQHHSENVSTVDVLSALEAVCSVTEHRHIQKHGDDAKFPCCCHQAGQACQVIDTFTTQLLSRNAPGYCAAFQHLLEVPDTPSPLYPSTTAPRILTLCTSVLNPPYPCHLCPFSPPAPNVHATPRATVLLPTTPLPSHAELAAAAHLTHAALSLCPTIAPDLLHLCCTCISSLHPLPPPGPLHTRSHFSSSLENYSTPFTTPPALVPLKPAPSSQLGPLELRRGSADTFLHITSHHREQLATYLLSTALDALNVHLEHISEHTATVEVLELAIRLATVAHTSFQNDPLRVAAVRGIATALRRHPTTLSQSPQLSAAAMQQQMRDCLVKARPEGRTGPNCMDSILQNCY